MLNSPWLPRLVAVEHRKDYDVAGFPLELECLDDGQGTERQNCELERENGGECCWSEKTTRNGAGTVVETLAQDWSSMDREMQYECAGGHQRSYAQLGWTCGKDGLQRNLCEGSQMSRPSMVEMATAKLERGGERQMVRPAPTAVQNLQVGGHGCWGGLQICWKRGWSVENCPRQHGLVAFCSKPWKLEAIFEMWKEPCIDGPGCLGDPEGIKKRCQNGRRCHDPTVALMVDLMMEASRVASMALMASMASMVASRASVVASMASMGSMMASRVSVVASMALMALLVESRKWLKRRAAELKRDDERVNGLAHNDELTLKIEGALTVVMMMASMAATMVAPEASLMASMALLVALLASMASMVASLDRLRLMIEPKSGEELADGLTHKICEERADEMTIKIDGERVGRLTHTICEERVDGLIKIKIDGERDERLTRKIREERVDGLTFKIDDEERADGWSAKTGEERADGWACRKVVEQMLVDGVGSENGGCNLAQFTPSTELQECTIRKWEELMTWGRRCVDGGGFDGVDGGRRRRRTGGGFDGGLVAWWRRMVASNGGNWGL